MNRPFIEIEGFPELMEKIKQLGDDKSKRQEVLKVLRQVANATVNVARANAPISRKPHLVSGSRTRKVIQPGALKKSIGTITGKSENPTILVGPRAKGNFDGWYGNFVENGHNVYRNENNRKVFLKSGRRKSVLARITKKRIGNITGRTRADLFMSRSYDQTKGQVTADAEKKFAAYIQKQIDRLSK